MSTILVTGGTGTLGKEIVTQLLVKNFRVEILSSKEKPELTNGATVIKGDLRIKETLNNSVRNADIIIHCASNPGNPIDVDIEGTKNLVSAATKGKSPHLIYVSIAGVDKSTFPYYAAKYEVENIIQSSNLPWSIVRATQFHDLVLSRFIKPLDVNNGLSLKIPQGLKFQSIDIKDVAAFLTEVSLGKPTKATTTIGGPEVLTIEQMTQIYLHAAKKHNLIEPDLIENDIFNLFRSGINLCPDNAVGKITWKQFILNNQKLDQIFYKKEQEAS